MKKLSYYNGTFGDPSSLSVPLSDRALFFGDGVYDAAVGERGRIFLAEEHLDRLFRNLFRLDIPAPMPREELSALLSDMAERAGDGGFFLYLQVSRDAPERRHARPRTKKSNLLVTLSPFAMPSPGKTLALIGYEDRRYEYCDIKTLNLLPSVLAATAADEAGADEAVFHRGRTVTECAHSNLFLLSGTTLRTHPADRFILPGIARRHLILAAERLGYGVSEAPFTVEEMRDADEVIVTSTTKLALRAASFDGFPLGGRAPDTARALIGAVFSEYADAMRAPGDL